MTQLTDKLRRIAAALKDDDQHLAKHDDLIPDLFEALAAELDGLHAVRNGASGDRRDLPQHHPNHGEADDLGGSAHSSGSPA